jgi:hypothetical protein
MQDSPIEAPLAPLEMNDSQIETQAAELVDREAALAETQSHRQIAGDEAGRAACQQKRTTEESDHEQRLLELERLVSKLDEQQAQARRERAELEQAQADLDIARSLLQREREALDAERTEAANRTAREEEAEPSEEELPTARAAADESTSEASAQADNRDHGDEDQSVEQYMAKLLHRMRGGKPADAVIAAEPKRSRRKSDPVYNAGSLKTESPKVDPAHRAAPSDRNADSSQVIDTRGVPVEMVRRPKPPQTTDLAAMRELANTQARIAIDIHGRKRLLKKTLGSLAAALACFLGTVLALNFVSSEHHPLRTGAIVGVVAGIYWMLGGVTALQQMMAAPRTRMAAIRSQIEQADANKSS